MEQLVVRQAFDAAAAHFCQDELFRLERSSLTHLVLQLNHSTITFHLHHHPLLVGNGVEEDNQDGDVQAVFKGKDGKGDGEEGVDGDASMVAVKTG